VTAELPHIFFTFSVRFEPKNAVSKDFFKNFHFLVV